MQRDQMIIIALVAILAVILVGIGYMLLNPTVEYQTLQLSNGSSIEAPKANDATWNQDPSGIRTYTCESKHTVVMSFNSQEDLNLVGAGAFAIARDVLMDGAKDVETYKDYHIKENTINKTHYYIVYVSSNETHDNIVIGSDNMDILKHMLDSLELGPPGEGPLNATTTESSAPAPTAPTQNNTNKNKYSEDDLMRASQQGYYNGYSDAIDDSYYYDDYGYDSGYDSYIEDDSGVSSDYISNNKPNVVDGSLE